MATKKQKSEVWDDYFKEQKTTNPDAPLWPKCMNQFIKLWKRINGIAD